MTYSPVSIDAALKQIFSKETIKDLMYRDNPFLAMVPKMTDFEGNALKVPARISSGQGRSVDMATAIANQSDPLVKAFLVTRVKDHAVGTILTEDILASKSDAGAFLDLAKYKIEEVLASLSRSIAISTFRDGSGSRGQSNAAYTSSAVLTLKAAEDVVNFEVGQTLKFATSASASLKSGVSIISAIDRTAGTLTMTANMTAIDGTTGVAANDFIFIQGDQGVQCKGLAAWIPYTAPTNGDSFFGVDRSVDVTRLAGLRVDISAMSPEEGVNKIAQLIGREGGRPTHMFVPYSFYRDLENSMSSKVLYTDLKITNEIMFRGIQINGPRGPIQVVADQNCPTGYGYMLDIKSWKLASLGDLPHLNTVDGLKMLRDSNSDGAQIRASSYYNLVCYAPGWNGVAKLS